MRFELQDYSTTPHFIQKNKISSITRDSDCSGNSDWKGLLGANGNRRNRYDDWSEKRGHP